MAAVDSPLNAAPPQEVPLSNAPLVRVIAQVRFPLVVAIEQRDFLAPFQEALRSRYPVLRQDQMQSVWLGPAGLAPQTPQIAWRFSDEASNWRISLAPDFLALETVAYSSRADFIDRFREAVTSLATHVAPKLIDRLGVRYIDRIVGDSVQDIVTLVKPEIRGILGTSLASVATHSVCESVFSLGDAGMIARWGSLPPGVTIDPTAMEPIDESSWILDLDMFTSASMPFSVDRAVEDATRFAERIYTFFRWAVTDEFLRRYGGKV
jgi:uncharacterized protein (TIGR04255 family)